MKKPLSLRNLVVLICLAFFLIILAPPLLDCAQTQANEYLNRRIDSAISNIGYPYTQKTTTHSTRIISGKVHSDKGKLVLEPGAIVSTSTTTDTETTDHSPEGQVNLNDAQQASESL